MSPSDPHDDTPHGPAIGAPFGPFPRIEARLGTGGMATVYRAVDPTGRRVALKVLRPSTASEEQAARFRREFDYVTRIDHPNIVRVYDSGATGAHAWISMELVEGEDLDATIARWRADPARAGGRFAVAERVFRGLAHALQHIHDRGFIHRDVKPANVLLTRTGQPKLSDFGAVTGEEASQITQVGRLVGTIAYMAPELIGDEPVDHRADLYALGALLYTMLTLQRPIQADSVAGYLARHLSDRPRPPHEIDPSVPRHLERVCLRLLEKSPDQRYPSARQAVEALEGHEARLDMIVGREEALRTWRERLQLLDAGLGGLVVLQGPPGAGLTTLLKLFADIARAHDHRAVWAAEEAPVSEDPDDPTLVTARHLGSTEAPVWLFDDLDVAPSVLRSRCESLVRGDRPVLVAATVHDPEARHGVLADAGTLPDLLRLTLPPLSAEDARTLLQRAGAPPSVARALGERYGDTELAQPGTLADQLDALIDAGWLARSDDRLRSLRPLSDFREGELPLPRTAREQILGALGHLDPVALELAELIAVLGGPVQAQFLARCADRPARVPQALSTLHAEGLVDTRAEDDGARIAFVWPGAASFVLERIPPERRRAHHLRVARHLGRGRRRTRHAGRVAHHLAEGGALEEALPLQVRAGRQHLRQGRAGEALKAVDRADALADQAGDRLSEDTRRRSLHDRRALRGAALLALGRWPQAVPVLEASVADAEQRGDAELVSRALSDLGRARYRLGAHQAAAADLARAIELGTTEDLDMAKARRTLADIHLRTGAFEQAEAAFRDALAEATRSRRSRDAEARARRGLAHAVGIQGFYDDAIAELDLADELLTPDGVPHVRAGVLHRAVELELVGGRLGSAARRAEVLLDLAQRANLRSRVVEALALQAVTAAALGQTDPAVDLARRALLLAASTPRRAWDGALRAARVLLDLAPASLDDLTLPDPATLPDDPLHDPRGQAVAVQAWWDARRGRFEAAERGATGALERTPALWGLSATFLRLDAARALLGVGQARKARPVLAACEALLDTRRADGALLEVAIVGARAGSPEAEARVAELAQRCSERLTTGQRATFLARPDIAALLGTHRRR